VLRLDCERIRTISAMKLDLITAYDAWIDPKTQLPPIHQCHPSPVWMYNQYRDKGPSENASRAEGAL
jgi:hypothetical protein